MALDRTEVDGVPVVWAPDGRRVRAGLVFRTGRADETLARGGITHLLEHLVMHRADQSDLHVNGVTSARTTTFLYAHDNDASGLTGFLAAVCAGLRDLPEDRLAVEKQVLRAEAGTRVRNAVDQLLSWRYGPASYGLPAFAEYGLDALTIDDLRDWAATRFTRGNAVLWISGAEPPGDLRLDLPEGERLPYPTAHSVLPRLPAYFTTDADGVAFDAVVPRSAASRAYAGVLARRMNDRLRRELGVSYHASAVYQPRDERHATVTAAADVLAEDRAATCRAFVDLLLDLARSPVDPAEIRTEPDADPAERLAAAAEDVLAGLPVAAAEPVSPEEVGQIARIALDTGLAMLPAGTGIGRAGFVPAPVTSSSVIDGTEYRLRNRPDAQARLIVGADGLSLVDGLDVATVRYATCPMMMAWPDGGRLLYAEDSIVVPFEPQLWGAPAAVRLAVDAAIPADRVVRRPAREPAAIPKPPDKPVVRVSAEPAFPAQPPWYRRHWRWLALGAATVLLFVIVGTIGAKTGLAGIAPFALVLLVNALAPRRK